MAKPKIANYEFTTLYPNLVVVLVSDYEKFVVADIPGLIKGASAGAGLGIQFLKHISRTKLLLHVIDLSQNNIEKIIEDVNIIATELEEYDDKLNTKDKWYVFNKIDLLSSTQLQERELNIKNKIKENVFFISAKNKVGLGELCDSITAVSYTDLTLPTILLV